MVGRVAFARVRHFKIEEAFQLEFLGHLQILEHLYFVFAEPTILSYEYVIDGPFLVSRRGAVLERSEPGVIEIGLLVQGSLLHLYQREDILIATVHEVSDYFALGLVVEVARNDHGQIPVVLIKEFAKFDDLFDSDLLVLRFGLEVRLRKHEFPLGFVIVLPPEPHIHGELRVPRMVFDLVLLQALKEAAFEENG